MCPVCNSSVQYVHVHVLYVCRCTHIYMYMHAVVMKCLFLVDMYHYCLRLEGQPPGVKMAGGVPGFVTPQLPRPGQKVAKKNALKIEK